MQAGFSSYRITESLESSFGKYAKPFSVDTKTSTTMGFLSSYGHQSSRNDIITDNFHDTGSLPFASMADDATERIEKLQATPMEVFERVDRLT